MMLGFMGRHLYIFNLIWLQAAGVQGAETPLLGDRADPAVPAPPAGPAPLESPPGDQTLEDATKGTLLIGGNPNQSLQMQNSL